MDDHAGAALGVEEERRAPAIAEFAGAVDGGVIRWDEREAEFVLAGERGSDFGVGADGIAVAGEVGAKGGEAFFHDAEIGADVGGGGIEGVGEVGDFECSGGGIFGFELPIFDC